MADICNAEGVLKLCLFSLNKLLLMIGLAINVINLFGMEERQLVPRNSVHKHTKSVPVGRSALEMQSMIQYSHEDLELGNEEVAHYEMQSSGLSISENDIIVPAELNQELSVRCRALLDKLGEAHTYHNPIISMPLTCSEKITYYCKKSGKWAREHKGTLTIFVVCGVICFYMGNRLARMTNLCGDAEDMCSDAIDQCGEAARLLRSCSVQASGLMAFINTIVRNGTAMCVEAAQECIDTVRAIGEICKNPKALDFTSFQ